MACLETARSPAYRVLQSDQGERRVRPFLINQNVGFEQGEIPRRTRLWLVPHYQDNFELLATDRLDREAHATFQE